MLEVDTLQASYIYISFQKYILHKVTAFNNNNNNNNNNNYNNNNNNKNFI